MPIACRPLRCLSVILVRIAHVVVRETCRCQSVREWLTTKLTRRRDGDGDENGFVLATLAVVLTVLIAVAALVVDVANWYLNAERLQRTADAAALGGSVYLPDDPTRANGEANTIVAANGLQSVTVDAHPVVTNPNRMHVTLKRNVRSVFAQVVGIDSLDITRAAEAQYTPPIPMGSPSNVLGMEPPGDVWQNPSVAALQGNYWLTIHGPNTSKIDGARWSAGACNGSPAPEECDRRLPAPQSNLVHAADGQKFVVHVPRGTVGTLAVEVFDAGFVLTGLHCESNMSDAESIDPVRYEAGDSPYCAGDTANGGGSHLMNTTFALNYPKDHPISPGGSIPSCPAQTFDGFSGNVGEEITNNPTGDVARTFHRWHRICTLNLASAGGGDYAFRVSAGSSGLGENQYAIRTAVLGAGGVLDPVASSGVNVYSQSTIEVLTQNSQQSMTFFLAKVRPGDAGRELTTELYSIGDDIPADVTILPPIEATLNGQPLTSFSDCTRVRPGETTVRPITNCTYPRAHSEPRNGEPGFAGRHGTITFPLPEGFSCDQFAPTGCWLRIQMSYTRAGTVQDTTSWRTFVDGQLVRITE
jgi:hypothetical protein